MPRLTRSQVPPIYGIADVDMLGVEAVPAAVRSMVETGLEWVQVRAKSLADDRLYELLKVCSTAVAERGAKLWVNDRTDLAVLVGAAGVHLGQEDLPARAARRLVDESCWIGASTHDLNQVLAADGDPAVDVIAVGPIYETTSKPDPSPVVGLELLAQARRATSKPLVAIGGIDEARLVPVLEAGADAVALISALCGGDVAANSRRLLARAQVARFGEC